MKKVFMQGYTCDFCHGTYHDQHAYRIGDEAGRRIYFCIDCHYVRFPTPPQPFNQRRSWLKTIIRTHVKTRIRRWIRGLKNIRLRIRFYFASPETQAFVLKTMQEALDTTEKQLAEIKESRTSKKENDA